MYSCRELAFCMCLCIVVKRCESQNFNVRSPRDVNAKGCVLPQHPKFGKWSIYEETRTALPNEVTKHRTILQVTCEEKFKLDGDTTIVCIDGKWTADIGDCLRTCPSRYSTAIMTVTCRNNERKLENCENPTDLTKARFQCADFYEDRALERNPIHVCFNGKWNHKLPECTPICGQRSLEDPTLIVGGRNATKGDYPWQVALYNATTKEQLCGGSLLNQRVILTAAHCITDEDGRKLSKELYLVAVGKYYRDFYHPEDHNVAQFSTIYEMHIPRQYKGDTQNFFGDLAILITKTTFTLSTRVQPVCVDWALAKFPITLTPKKIKLASVSGWGYTIEYNNPSTVLKEVQVPIIEEQECRKKIPEDYDRFLTDDKLCAGFINRGTSVCKGDSGGGLVARHNGRYYVIGVVSLAPQAFTEEGGCDSHQYSLYTKVQYYIDTFILDKQVIVQPTSGCGDDPNCNSPPDLITTTSTTTQRPVTEAPKGTCILPNHPNSGKWTIYGVSNSFSPGTVVTQGTILRISCNNNYKLTGSNVTVCDNGNWSPTIGYCGLSCPPLRSSKTTQVSCSHEDKELPDCSNPVDGTIAKQKCAPFYEDLQLAKNPVRICRNGSWDMSRSECVPICGLKSVSPQKLIVNGNTVKKGEYPWQVAIYQKKRQIFICGGALISPRLILTAAHCVTNFKGQVQPKENYIVVVGTYYREFLDDKTAQSSEIQDIYIPVEYAGVSSNYLADIAVIVTKDTFTLNARVQPACVDWGLKYVDALTKNVTGYVAGWGFTKPNSNPSDTLQDLAVPIVPREECMEKLPEDFLPYVTQSTFCGGYINQNVSLCSGDAGGAFVSKHDGRYYVNGIVSTAPSIDAGCDSNQLTVFTRVSDFVSFILEKDAKVKASSAVETDCLNNGDCPTTTVKPPPQPEIPSTTCTLPEHPEFGKWTVFGTTATYRPRELVAVGTILQVSCYKSYKLEGDATILCEKGKWSSTIGKCLRTCPAVSSTKNTKATCIINNQEFENCAEPTDGTRVKYKCAPFHDDPNIAQNPIHVCKDGSWSHQQPQCLPVCGQKHVIPETLIVNGKKTKSGDYPWHVAIYRGAKNDFICSGTLISPQVVLTAAQCVTDFNAKARSAEDFTAAAGKFYRKFDDPRDAKTVQTSKLLEIAVHPSYKGVVRTSTANIAMLVTSKRFTVSFKVQPVCIDWGLTYDRRFKPDNLTGYVTGWGYTLETSNPSDELQELEVPIVSNQICESQLPEAFLNFLTYDKFCAGYRNQDKSVCTGDSGGGLVAKFNGKYYITGVVDSAPTTPRGGCDSQQYAIYTRVSFYIDNFILEKVYQYRY